MANLKKEDALIELFYPLFDKTFFAEPVGLIALSAYLKREGYNVHVDSSFLDGYSCNETAKKIFEKRPFLVGVSINCAREVIDGLSFIRTLRECGYTGYCVAGGDFAGFHRIELMESEIIDAIILGEGEEPFDDLLLRLLNNERFNDIAGVVTPENHIPALRKNMEYLDDLPFLDREVLQNMIKKNGYCVDGIQASLPTSRGCYGGCAFCSIWKGVRVNTGNCFREFGVHRVVSELNDVHEKYGIYDFYLCSAQFLPQRLDEAEIKMTHCANEIGKLDFLPSIFLYLRCDNVSDTVAQGLVNSGVSTVFIGVESFDDRILTRLNKGLTSLQIQNALSILEKYGYSSYYRAKYRMKLGFIMFTQWTDLEGLKINLDGCRRFRIPPKKMIYTLQIHRENDLDNPDIADTKVLNIEFSGLSENVAFVRSGYLKILDIILPLLETMRAYQKAKLPISTELSDETWRVVDAINDFAYDAFGRLIDISENNRFEDINIIRDDAKHLVDNIGFDKVVNRLRKETPAERLSCVESHLERGLDNPQIWSSNDKVINAPLIGRIP